MRSIGSGRRSPSTTDGARGRAGGVRRRARRRPARRPPTVWCSWYRYFEEVTAADVAREPPRLRRARPVRRRGPDRRRVEPRSRRGPAAADRFGSLPAVVDAIRGAGTARRHLAGAVPRRHRDHPGPRAPGLAGRARRAQLGPGPRRAGPDPPGVRELLPTALRRLVALGVDYLKLDFLYARRRARSAPRRRPTRVAAYRSGLALRPRGRRPGRLPGRVRSARCCPAWGWSTRCASRPTPSTRAARTGPTGLRGLMPLAARAWQQGRLLGQRPGLRGGAAVVLPAGAVGGGGSGARRSRVLLRPGRRARRAGGSTRCAPCSVDGGRAAPFAPDRVRAAAALARPGGGVST